MGDGTGVYDDTVQGKRTGESRGVMGVRGRGVRDVDGEGGW